MVLPLQSLSNVTDEESERIERECSVLFAEKSTGIADPCEAISLHAMLLTFWEDYGLNYFDAQKLPVRFGLLLREVQRHKITMQAQQMDKATKQVRGVRPGARG